MNTQSPFWHQRFLQQARWTRDLRFHLYKKLDFKDTRQILDIGCGTGALWGELIDQANACIFGVDINSDFLSFARQNHPGVNLVRGDAHRLPFPDQSIDLSLCHFVLLWVENPDQVIQEMTRVTRRGKPVLALAEPDYGGRIDYPLELESIGELQKIALQRQGAKPEIGRRLAEIYCRADLESIEVGVLGGHWQNPFPKDEWEREWLILRDDLSAMIDATELASYQQSDLSAWEKGRRILFVPTFYAIGYVPK